MRGRKPLPTQMKIIRGNPGKRPLNDAEPKPRAKIPPCPAHLRGEARREWRRISKELHAVGLLTTIDRAALAGYCASYARWVEAEDGIRRNGLLVKTPNGFPVQSPLIAIANKAMKQMLDFIVQFGMTPSSRTRVTAAPDTGAESNPFLEIAKGA